MRARWSIDKSTPPEKDDDTVAGVSSADLLKALPDSVFLVDPVGIIRYVTEGAVLLTGFTRDDLVGHPVENLVPGDDRAGHQRRRLRFSRDPRPRPMGTSLETKLVRKDGSEVHVDIGLGMVPVGSERWTIAAIRDASARRSVEQARVEAEQRFRLAFEGNMAPMIFADLDDVIFAANDAFCEMIGRTRDEILGSGSKPFTYHDDVGITEESHQRMVHGQVDQIRYVKRYLHKDGRVIIVEVSKAPARDSSGKILYYIISERDITEERKLTAQLSHQALHDPLTGLPNRALFEDRLSQAHERVIRQGGLGAVLLLDLDDFKGVNDTLGHVAGDELLKAIAGRLRSVTRASDTLCRFGGDEFLYLAEGLGSESEAEHLAVRLHKVLAESIEIEGAKIEQHASIGVAVWDATSTNYMDLIQAADMAMYEAKGKRQSTGHHVVFTPGMHQQATSRFALIQELRHALHAGELTMQYQPILNLVTTEVVGFEALVRWQHPERGWISPGVFIPLAEQSELILELGHFALREALATAKSWQRRGDWTSRCFVTVNLSAHQFHDPGLVPMIEATLAEYDLPPGCLIIEITESVTLRDVAETLSVMNGLSHIGVDVALDDFGTGYTSLSYLTRLNPRIIKIDGSFVDPQHESDRSGALLEAIISLGNKFNVTMLGEGIETEEQLERLRGLDCELGQGFLFSPAVPADEVFNLFGGASGKWR